MADPVAGPEDVRQYYPRFSDQEMRRRYELVRQAMDARGVDCLIVYGDPGHHNQNQANPRWLSNYADFCFYSYVVFPLRGDPTVFTSFYYHEAATRIISCITDVRSSGWFQGSGPIAQRIKELGLERGRIGVVGVWDPMSSSIPHDHYAQLVAELPGATFEPATRWYERLRQVKSAEEIAFMRKACAAGDAGMAAFVAAARAGATEWDLHTATVSAIYQAGSEYMLQLMGSTPMRNPSMIYPRQYPSNRTLREGDIVNTELSASYNGYNGQLQRCVFLGEPTPEYKKLAELALEVMDRTARALRPGNTMRDVLAGNELFTRAGYRNQILAHGMSMLYELPFIGVEVTGQAKDEEEFVFQPGMTFVNQPNPYTPDVKLGVFLGNMTLITETGSEPLQKYPLKLIVV